MDLNVAPAQTTTQRKQQQLIDQPLPSGDQPVTSSEAATATDERAQLFTVTKPKKKQLPEEASVTTAASEDDDRPSELTAPAPAVNNVVDDVVKSPVGDETISDEEEEILDIN